MDLKFPGWAGVVADAVLRAAQGLTAESSDVMQRRPGEIPYELVIRRTEFVWRFFLAHKEDRVVLFFFRDSGEATVVLRTEVRLAIAATARVALPAGDLRRVPIRWEAVVPAFVLVDPDAPTVRRHAGDDADIQATTLLRLSNDAGAILAVVGDDEDAVVVYTTAQAQSRLDDEPRWEPFLALLGLVRGWVESDGRAGVVVPGLVRAGGPRGALGACLRELVAGYAVAAQRLIDGARANARGDVGHTEYGVTDFRGDVTVRLDEAGDLVSGGEDEATQVRVAVELRHADDHIDARVTLIPSDFLVRDALCDAIVTEVGRALETWRTRLFEKAGPSAAELGAVLRGRDTRSFTFRVERDVQDGVTRDKNVVVWEASVGASRRVLLVDAWLAVDTDASPPTAAVRDDDDLEVTLYGDPTDRATPVSDTVRGYAARFVVDLRRALDALR